MENKLFEKLDNLNMEDVSLLLLDKDINLSVGYCARKRIEKSVYKKTGYYDRDNMFIKNINDILGRILMKRKLALALSVMAISGLGGGIYAHAKTTPVAYVSMDINPSVELGINTFDEVVSVEAYNKDGEKVLEGTNLVDGEIDEAVNTLIKNAISEGYINEDGSSAIEVTTATDKEDVATELEESLKKAVDETLNNNNIEAEVETENVALARRDEARELGITPGKLNLIQKLQALDPTITVEDYKDSSVKDIQKKTKELRKDNKVNKTTTAEEGTNATDKSDAAAAEVTTEENTSNSSNNGNDNVKNQEAANQNNKKEENNSTSNKEKDTTTTDEKQNNSNNLNSQNNNSDQQNKSNNKEKSKNN